MKKITVLILMICLIVIGCVKSPGGHVAAAKKPIKSQKFIGRFQDNVNIYRKHGDTIEIQREQETSFDVYKLDMNTAGMKYEYTTQSKESLLYYKQLSSGNALEVKRLGNSEEDNVLLLRGKVDKEIAKKIAYSEGALVSTSPSERYIIYCTAEPIVNRYSLHVYDMEKNSTLQLIGTANEELLNDMEWSINWSPGEKYIAVSNKLILDISNASVLGEINASVIGWSPSGSKLAYIKPGNVGGKTLYVLDIANGQREEMFVTENDEYLSDYLVWNQNETKLAIVIASVNNIENEETHSYKAIYSLDLNSKEAIRIDTALKLNEVMVSQIENISYNDSGRLISIVCTASQGSNLHVFNLENYDYKVYLNVEYLHYENNESYVCSSRDRLYFVQGEKLIELNDNMEDKVIKSSNMGIDDIYISKDGNSMIVIENQEESLVLRHMTNFSSPI